VSTGPTSAADETRSLLLAVRLRPSSPADRLAALLHERGLAVADVPGLLGRLALADLVECRGAPPRWRLTADGRAEGERLLAAEVDGLGARDELTAVYERFLELNGPLLHACTAWQLRDPDPAAPVVNDHGDPVYDRTVIARLAAIHEAVLPVLDRLAAALPRFAAYRPWFEGARARIAAGDHAGFDGAADSYHSIWFELHDHLLATLGRDRAREPLPVDSPIDR
jgi:hypothetical protein